LQQVTELAVHFLDNVVDLSKFAADRVENTSKANRRVGLGIMGFADYLLKRRISYAEQEGRDAAEELMKFVDETAWNKSYQLAEWKGPFPNVDKSIWKDADKKPRNCAVTNAAPTGSISMAADCSSGIEPNYALSFTKTVMNGTVMQYDNKYLKEALEEVGLYNDKIMSEVRARGSLKYIKEIPDHIKRVFVTSMDITPEAHVLMQAALQKYTSNALSKTINFPHNATMEDIAKGYLLAWKTGCKGITVYRDGSRYVQVLSTQETPQPKEESSSDLYKKDICPDCRAQLRRSEGCKVCDHCSFSACSL
jgi:ribonucleoside-diphosphate reductase alpha chain